MPTGTTLSPSYHSSSWRVVQLAAKRLELAAAAAERWLAETLWDQ